LLREEAYLLIRDKIVSGEYAPGAYLNEAGLEGALGFGKQPIKQAVARLALERLVVIMPRKGMFVRPLSIDDAMHIADARDLNESMIVRLAAERAEPRDLAAMSDCLARAARNQDKRPVTELIALDREFHSLVAKAARHPVLEDIANRLQEQSLRFWYVSLSQPSHVQDVRDEHQAIYDAIASHDADTASKAAVLHIWSFRSALRYSQAKGMGHAFQQTAS
jgi:DNA-binding GntR family transcriptional regulator